MRGHSCPVIRQLHTKRGCCLFGQQPRFFLRTFLLQLLHPVPASVILGGHFIMILELFRKIAGTVEPRQIADVRNALRGRPKQLCSLRQTVLLDIFDRGQL